MHLRDESNDGERKNAKGKEVHYERSSETTVKLHVFPATLSPPTLLQFTCTCIYHAELPIRIAMRPLCLGLLFVTLPAFAGAPLTPATDECCQLDLWTGEGISVGKWLLPEINYMAAAGSSTTDPERLAVGHHDPDRHGITQQNIEFSLTARLGAHASLFATYATKIDQDDHWADEFEEYYLTLEDLPFGARFKGGRFYTEFGFQNRLHPHDFTFIDQYLGSGRMIGEDSLTVYGGEISIPVLRNLPTNWNDRLTVSFGAIPDPEEEDHGHFGPEGAFESEGAAFADWAATANYRVGYNASETTRYEFGLSGAWGRNDYGRTTQVYGLQLEYLWSAAGVNGGGHSHAHAHHDHLDHDHDGKGHAGEDSAEFFRWRSEVFVRHFGAVSGHDEEEEHEPEVTVIPGQPEVRRTVTELIGRRIVAGGLFVPIFARREVVVQEAQPARVVETHEKEEHTEVGLRDEFTDMGFYTALSYGFPSGKLQAHLRAEYVSGVSEAGLPERWRVSPALAWYPSDRLPIHFKLQYNYDHSPSFGDEHSVWAQFSLTWGDCCAHD